MTKENYQRAAMINMKLTALQREREIWENCNGCTINVYSRVYGSTGNYNPDSIYINFERLKQEALNTIDSVTKSLQNEFSDL